MLPSYPVEMTGGYKIMLEYANELSRKGDDVMVYFVMMLPYTHVKHSDLYFWLKSWWFKWRKPSWFELDEKVRVKSIYSARDTSNSKCRHTFLYRMSAGSGNRESVKR